MTTKHTFQDNVLRVVAVVGLIAVLLLGAWGIIQLAFFIPSFLGNIGSSLAPKNQAPQAITAAVVQQATSTIKTVVATPKPAAPVKKSAAATTYVPSGRTTNLYGYPDLVVRIMGAPSSVRAGGQVSLQIIIENVGTNIVPANWIFTASLPYLPASQAGSPTYTYQSPMQQALYPGDKVVYTLGYTAQYVGSDINPCSGWTYPCTNPTPVYGGPGTCNAYGPCNIPGYMPNVYGYTYPSYGGVQSASITVDPYNLVWELSESNNYAATNYSVY